MMILEAYIVSTHVASRAVCTNRDFILIELGSIFTVTDFTAVLDKFALLAIV